MDEKSFFENYATIEDAVEKRRYRWKLKVVNYIDYDDVKSVIIHHIYKKWHLFNPKKGKLEAWLASVISNQISNLLRNFYYSFAKVCKRCPASEGDDESCRVYGKQDASLCPILAKWESMKKNAYSVKIPVSIHFHDYEIFNKQDRFYNYEKGAETISRELQKTLTPFEFRVYQLVYMDVKSDKEAAIELGFKGTENQIKGIKLVLKAKKKITSTAKDIAYNSDVDLFPH